MKKVILSLLIVVLISGFGANYIFAEETLILQNETTTTIISTADEEISVLEALELKNVGLLSNSPFYFLKEWWRGFKMGFIQDPVKKGSSQLQILSEKLAEIEAMAQKGFKKEALEEAFENYSLAMDKLKERLLELQGTSENPSIDEMLDKIAEAEIRHQEVLDKILEHIPEMASHVETIRQQISQTLPFLRLQFENQEEFMNRLENKFQELKPLNSVATSTGEFLQLRIMEQVREQIQQAPLLEGYSEGIQNEALQLKERLENKILQKTQSLRQQGFSSEMIEEAVQRVNQLMPIIPVENLPQSPPPGVNPPGNPPGNSNSGNQGGSFQNPTEQIDACIELWDPVCGVNGITYSNDCFAAQAGVAVQYQGECQ